MATPIGNLDDLSFRAVEVLRTVDLIVCEDTRHSRPLLDHYGIDRPLTALHEYNETNASNRLLASLQGGTALALISDAGTPLINDPGFPLIRLARSSGIRVVPVPGPCALIAALSASGLPADRFCFEGFPPRKAQARQRFFESLVSETRTLVFYEAAHRIDDSLNAIAAAFPPGRRLVVARELTKIHETFVLTNVADAPTLFRSDPNLQRGEFVLILEGAPLRTDEELQAAEVARVLRALLRECTLRTAVGLATEITGVRRDVVYRTALELATLTPGEAPEKSRD